MNLLFLGDSITDCGHCFTQDDLGTGYVIYLGRFLAHMPSAPGALIKNGGTDGFTFPRTLQKWRQSYRDTSWDTIVLTGGINETGYIMDSGQEPDRIRQYLEWSMEALHELIASMIERRCYNILLVEPFLFPIPEYRRLWLPCLKEVRRLIRETALDFPPGCVQILPVQEEFDFLVQKRGMAAVTTDGIHLTDEGNKLLAQLILPHLCL